VTRVRVRPMTGWIVPAATVPGSTHPVEPGRWHNRGPWTGGCCPHRPCCWCLRDVLAWMDGRT